MRRFELSIGSATLAAVALVFSAPAHAGDTKDIAKGAIIGGAGGAVVGALDKDGKKWYRDSNGRKYWIDKRGRRHYKN